MAYNNPDEKLIDSKFTENNEDQQEQTKEMQKYQALQKQGSPLNWVMQAAGAAAGLTGALLSGDDWKTAGLKAVDGAINPMNAAGHLVTGATDKAGEKKAEAAAEAEQAAVDQKKEQAKLEANATSGNNISAGGYGEQVGGVDPSQSVLSDQNLNTDLVNDPTGASTTGSTAVAKKLGEVKPYYENKKMSAAQYKRSIAMMTISGVSSLEKKGCYKPK